MVAPVVVAALTPFVKDLFANGLNMLGKAIVSKGKEAVEEKLGVKLPDADKPMTPEQAQLMREIEFKHEEVLIQLAVEKAKVELDLEKVGAEAVTRRWEADMLSDSWLSKNIRPIALVHTFIAFDLLMLCALFSITVPDGYLALLKELLIVMVGAYFVGRTIEKGVDIHQGWKQTKGE